MSQKLTKKQRIQKHYTLSQKLTSVITGFNDSMYKLFYDLSFFTQKLPEHLNSLSYLSDMITDALVVTGKSSLSKTSLELNVVSNNNIMFNKELNTIRLGDSDVYKVPLQNDRSYIQTENTYNIHAVDNDSLMNFSSLLSGTPIKLVSTNRNYRYTFCLEFPARLDINSLNIKLNLKTKSYPLLSELFLIDKENKRQYITILNTMRTSIDLDEKRVENNDYELLFDNVNTNKIYFTLEDRNNNELMIDELNVKKVEYFSTGEIVFGPIASTYPILKAAIEANGDLEGAEFYLSYNTKNWIRLVLPTEVSKVDTASKIVSFNTVSSDSLKVQGDVKELYLRVVLNHKQVEAAKSNTLYKGESFYSATLNYPLNEVPQNGSVYQTIDASFYGDKTYLTNVSTSDLREPEHNYISVNGSYKVKGFTSTNHSYFNNEVISNAMISSSYLKVNGDVIDASSFNPLTSTAYGYVVNRVKRVYNTLKDKDVVIPLKGEYSKDVYTIRQNNKEVRVDLSLGFITSTITSVIGVDEEGEVLLFDSTGREIKELTIREFDTFNYVSLVLDGLFDLPILSSTESLLFNDLYPIRLNEDKEFGILDNNIVCVQSLIDFMEYSKLQVEKLETNLELSKENKNTLTLADKQLKDKYTEKTEETVKAFTKSRAIKLKNKHIKKGSLRIVQT